MSLMLLARAYNRMILQIQDQKERLRFKASEEAWREMAKQVAHEVKKSVDANEADHSEF